jgi:UDP-N-acetylglucosamine acyltransferase
MSDIHSTAVVEPGARIGAGVSIGPFCCVGPEVELGEGVRLAAHVVLAGRTVIGPRTRIFPFASLGQPPQHLGYRDEPSRLVIGADNIVREHVTISPGTAGGGMETRIGDHCFLMVGVHVAHDCRLGDRVIMANNATLGGHVTVGDHVVIGGLSAVHQFVRIGRHAMIGGMTAVAGDVIPYGMVAGPRGGLSGLNVVGMKRRSIAHDDIHVLRSAYRRIFASADGAFEGRVNAAADAFAGHPLVAELVDFIRCQSDRPLCQPAGDEG